MINCYETNYLSDVLLQDENNKENSFDNIGNSYYAYRKSKMKNETNYGLRISKDSINQGQWLAITK